MGTITLTNTLTNGTTADAEDVMEDLNDITDVVNGGIDNDNISATAAIVGSKLNLAIPGAIGGTTPAAGTFTTLTGTTLVIGSGTYDKTRYINLLPTGAIFPAANYPALAQTDGTNFSYWTLAFEKDTDESCFWVFDVPAEYDAGNVTITVKAVSTATSGGVSWTVKTATVADAGTLDSSLGSEVIFDAKTVDGSAGDIFEQSKTFDPGWTAGNLAVLQLLRNVGEAGDTAAADVKMVIAIIEWEVA